MRTSYVNCCVCKETCYHSYYYAEGDYYCEDCHRQHFKWEEWEDLHKEFPDEFYWSCYSEDEYRDLIEMDIADFERDDMLIYE